MRVLVCGGRYYDNKEALFEVLNERHAANPITVLINGGASGADHLAAMWAGMNCILTKTFEADWSIGRSAGPIRNARMITEGKPDMVIAFPGWTRYPEHDMPSQKTPHHRHRLT